jgi:hypothetical protein
MATPTEEGRKSFNLPLAISTNMFKAEIYMDMSNIKTGICYLEF